MLFSIIILHLLQSFPLCLLYLLRKNQLGIIVAAWDLCGKMGQHTPKKAFNSVTAQSTLKTMEQRRGQSASVYQCRQLVCLVFIPTSKSHTSSCLSTLVLFQSSKLTFLEHLEETYKLYLPLFFCESHAETAKCKIVLSLTHIATHLYIFMKTVTLDNKNTWQHC